MGKLISTVFTIVALLAWDQAARAAIMFDYQGNNFTNVVSPYSTGDNVSGWIELASELQANANDLTLAPVAFSFTDGVQTITNLNALIATFNDVDTDIDGLPVEWNIQLCIDAGCSTNAIETIDALGLRIDTATSGGVTVLVSDDPGSWEYKTVPEPATISLVGIGLAGLACLRRRKRQ